MITLGWPFIGPPGVPIVIVFAPMGLEEDAVDLLEIDGAGLVADGLEQRTQSGRHKLWFDPFQELQRARLGVALSSCSPHSHTMRRMTRTLLSLCSTAGFWCLGSTLLDAATQATGAAPQRAR